VSDALGAGEGGEGRIAFGAEQRVTTQGSLGARSGMTLQATGLPSAGTIGHGQRPPARAQRHGKAAPAPLARGRTGRLGKGPRITRMLDPFARAFARPPPRGLVEAEQVRPQARRRSRCSADRRASPRRAGRARPAPPLERLGRPAGPRSRSPAAATRGEGRRRSGESWPDPWTTSRNRKLFAICSTILRHHHHNVDMAETPRTGSERVPRLRRVRSRCCRRWCRATSKTAFEPPSSSSR
jgi:hypothetical protein